MLHLLFFLPLTLLHAADCTRGTNPYQNAKDRLNNIYAQVLESASSLRRGDRTQATKLLTLAGKSAGSVRAELESKSRAFPTALRDSLAFAVKKLDADDTDKLAKAITTFAATLSCPVTHEPLVTTLLPPDPAGEKTKLGSLDYRVFVFTQNHELQLVKEWLSVPLGDCPDCKRGIALNCATPGKCEAGLRNGVGLRVFFERKNFRITVKNGTSYRLQSQNELPLPFDQKVDVSFLSEAENLTYRVEFFLKRS